MNLNELGVTIAHGGVLFRLSGKWQSVSNQMWAWRYLTVMDEEAGVRWGVWVPKLLLTDPWEHHFRPRRLTLPRLSSSGRNTPTRTESVASPVFDFIRNSGDYARWHWKNDDSFGYTDRELVRTCRLVCRDWAKRAPLGDPKLKVVNGVIWHCAEDEWLVLPKKYWAWVFQKIEWWVERRQQDNMKWKWKGNCKAWYPKLIRPVDDSVGPKGKARSMTSLSVTREQYRTHLEPCIGPRFLENVRDINARELYRACRLVCRDWASRYPLGNPERGKLWLREGIMWLWMEGCWRVLSSGYWAWAFQDVEWWAERLCLGLSCREEVGCTCQRWYPMVRTLDSSGLSKLTYTIWQLLQPSNGTIQQEPEVSLRPLSCKLPTSATAFSLPQELFRYICIATESESWSWRLVCRYWNEQCTPRIFKSIAIDQAPERIRALWHVRAHLTFKQHVKVLHGVPIYHERTMFPWIHLLTQICASTQAVWRLYDEECSIALLDIGQTIRSVHFALPRSVPRSFSRGIRSLHVCRMRFHRIEDLTHLACELPDLEALKCNGLTFDTLQIELPRRRPRKSRNKLKEVELRAESNVKPMPPPIAVLSLFLSVYDASSFFSDGDVAAFLSLAVPPAGDRMIFTYEAEEHTRQLDIRFPARPFTCYFRFNDERNSTKLKVGIDASDINGDPKYYLDHWKDIDITFSRLHSESSVPCTQVVFGFRRQEYAVLFAENVLGQLRSISEHFTVRYSVLLRENNERDWYQASLDSEVLRGKPKEDLLDVYT